MVLGVEILFGVIKQIGRSKVDDGGATKVILLCIVFGDSRLLIVVVQIQIVAHSLDGLDTFPF